MSPRYWIKISLGALVIFAVGMVFVNAGHKGSAWADQVAHSASTISIPLVFVPFRLDGESVGSIKRLDIIREAPEVVSGALIAVKLNDNIGLPAEGCALAIDDLDDIGDGATFYCADEAAQAAGELVPFGTVEFSPDGVQRTLLLPMEVVEEIMDDMDVDLDTDVRAALNASQQIRLERVQRARAHHEVISQEIAAQSAEAAISIRIMDALNEAGIMLDADANGAYMSIKDGSTGSKLLMRADSEGFALTVDENGESKMQMRADSQGFVLRVQGADGAEVVTSKNDN